MFIVILNFRHTRTVYKALPQSGWAPAVPSSVTPISQEAWSQQAFSTKPCAFECVTVLNLLKVRFQVLSGSNQPKYYWLFTS